ncbi:TPA: hypothetical protein ACQOKP_001131, partial [Streptococcus pyogenes]
KTKLNFLQIFLSSWGTAEYKRVIKVITRFFLCLHFILYGVMCQLFLRKFTNFLAYKLKHHPAAI